MQVYKEITPLQRYLNNNKSEGKSIGLVPTMGALHEGHLSLLEASVAENDITICSLYVNPVQFNNPDDLKKYPRTLEQDLLLLQDAGCDVVFCPSDDMMYQQPPKITFNFGGLDTIMEGKFRPGHFSGVGLVVCKLFNIVGPHRVYFGQKDLQQFVIINQLIKDLSYPIVARCLPIIRDSRGLALSSRNKRLTPEGKETALILYRTLRKGAEMLDTNSGSEIKEAISGMFDAAAVKLDYFEIVDPDTLENIENNFSKKNVALCVAGFVEEVRLIDNIIINFADQ